MILSALTEDSNIEVLHKALAVRPALIQFCGNMLASFETVTSHERAVFQKVWTSIAMQPILNAYTRVAKFCRCIMHLFCAELPLGVDETTNDDVTYFVTYDDGELFEKSIRKLLRDPSLWWITEVNDMKKTAATAILGKEKFSELSTLLEGDSTMSIAGIKRAFELLEDLKGSMRSQKLGDVVDRFVVPKQHWWCWWF